MPIRVLGAGAHSPASAGQSLSAASRFLAALALTLAWEQTRCFPAAHFARVLAPFERIVHVDRHGILPYQDAGSEVRNGTKNSRSPQVGIDDSEEESDGGRA